MLILGVLGGGEQRRGNDVVVVAHHGWICEVLEEGERDEVYIRDSHPLLPSLPSSATSPPSSPPSFPSTFSPSCFPNDGICQSYTVTGV